MLTLEYLRTVLDRQLSGIADTEKQIIESAGGYDGIVSLVQTKMVTPLVILENSEVGELSVRPGGFNKQSQSIWVMKMVGRDDDRRTVQDDCFAMMKKIISVFIKHEKDPELDQWVWDSIPWSARNAGANFTGYEFVIHFSEDIDLFNVD